MFRNSAFAGALAFVCTLSAGVFAPATVSAQVSGESSSAPAPTRGLAGVRLPTTGGVTQRTDEIMQRQAAAPPRGERPDDDLDYPDRSQLPQNPLALPVSRIPSDAPSAPAHALDIHTTSVAFNGGTLADTGAFPPDSMGTAGPTQFIVFINGRIRSFTRAGVADGVLDATPDVFFAPVMTPVGGAVVLNFTSDPQIRYDRFTSRWYLSIIDVPCTNATCTTLASNRWMLAVSDAASNGTITGATTWTMLHTPVDATNFCDYPSLGVDVNALYFGCNMFTPTGSFSGTNGYVVQKSSTLGAGPMTVTGFANLAASSGAGPFAPRGADNFDPSATEGYFVGVDNATFGTIMFRRVIDPGSATPTISANISVPVSTTSFPNPVEHLGNTGGNNGRLDSLDDRLFAATIRDGRLWTAHNMRVTAAGVAGTAAQTRNGARWYEFQNLTATPTVVQSGTVHDNATTRAASHQYFIPSIAPTGQGHAVIAFSEAGAVGATPSYTGRLASDPPGTMAGVPGIGVVQFGTSAANYNPPSDPGGSGGRRWGDYSFTAVDPLDDMSVWTIQEYNQAAGSYAVRVGKLLAPPPATPTCSAAPLGFGGGTGDVTLVATSASGSGFYDPGADLAPPAQPFSHIGATMTNATVNSITYDSPTQVTLNITANVNGLQDVTITNPDGQSVTAVGCIDVTVAPLMHTVTPSVGTPSGSIAPNTPQSVNDGATTSFTLTPDAGFQIDTVGGTCGGNLAGNLYTTDPVTADCTVIANFTQVTHIVTPSSGGNGTIVPSTPQTVNDGGTIAFALNADAGFQIDTVGGTCGGSLSGNLFTTDPVGADCTVVANFSPIVVADCSTGDEVEVLASAGTLGPIGYTTLKGAFDAINAGTHQGDITVDICADTTETASAVLLASGTGPASYATIAVQPAGGGARTVGGAIAAGSPLVDLSGADNVTIDGLNTGGHSLTLANTTASATAGTSTIRFIGGATGNTVTRCTVLGSSSAAAATATGNLLFSTSTVAGGNSNNTVSDNDIGPAGGNLPTKGVMGAGTAANPNAGNVVDGNRIFDFFSPSVASAGISTGAGNTNWTISNNRIYQTAPRTFSGTALRYSGILVASANGTFNVTGNTIGFGAADGTGTTTIGGSTNEVRGIAFTSSNTLAGQFSTISNNTISGLHVTSNRNSTSVDLSPFIGIQSGSSATDAPANILGNTIGSLDGSSTIVVNAGSTTASTSPVQGILDFNFVGNVSVSGNSVGSITINDNAGVGTLVGFRGILVSSTTGVTHTISNNTIGGTAPGSITDTIVGSVSMYGIQTGAANIIAGGNVIRNLAGNSTTPNGVVMSGLLSTGSTGQSTISDNVIHSLSNNSGAASNSIYALYLSFGAASNSLVQRNLVHSLSLASSATTSQLAGILPVAGSATYQNNMVRLGIDAAGAAITTGLTMYGMFEIAGTNNLYHNSVYVGGSGVNAASNTFAFVSNVASATRNYVDNIFWNARSNASGTGKNYAIAVSGSGPNPPGLASDYNDLYASGSGGFTGLFGAVDRATLDDWRTATGVDTNSFAGDPRFVAPEASASAVDLHIDPALATPVEGSGLLIAAVADDYDGNLRANLTPTDVGADAGDFIAVVGYTVTPSVGTPSGSITPSTPQTVVAGGTTSFTLLADAGFHIDNVAGTCGGSLVGNVFTTAAVNADCTVVANFAADVVTHVVTPGVGTPSGTIAPSTPQTVNDGDTTSFTLTPDAGFEIDGVGGTCGGSLAGNVFTTAPVTADCTVIANFAADTGGIPGTFPPEEDFDEQTAPNLPSDWPSAASGSGVPFVTVTTAADSTPNAAYAPEFATVADMTLDTPVFTPVANQTLTFRHQYILENSTVTPTTAFDAAVLEISINGSAFQDIVAAGGSFLGGGYDTTVSTGFSNPLGGRAAWSGDSGGFVTVEVALPPAATGQLSVLRFRTADDSSVVVGPPNGWWIDTIALGVGLPPVDPLASFDPTSFSFTVAANETATDTLTIGNAAGSDPLTFAIQSRDTTTGPILRPHVAQAAEQDRSLHAAMLREKGDPAVRQPSRLAAGDTRGGIESSAPWAPVAPDGTFTFQLDDGTYENNIGLGTAGPPATESAAVWINRFEATQALTIDSISILWPQNTGGTVVGLQANLVAYYDADADGDATNAVRLGTDNLVTIAALDVFETYPANFSVPAAGDVYIGFVDQWAIAGGYQPRLFPAAIDEDPPSQGRSHISGAGTPPTDITNLGNNDLNGIIDGFGLPGNWLIRATGTGGGGGPCTGPIVNWLGASPANGSVNGGNSVDVTITVDPSADSLGEGSYSAELCVTTNDPTQLLVAIPVDLTVTAPVAAFCDGGADTIFCGNFEGTGGGGPATFDNRADFVAATAAGYFENPFNDAVPGLSPALSYSQGGWAYTVDSTTPDNLFNDTGLISTNFAADAIIVTFTGDPVTAVGGNFWASDISVFPTGTDVIITLSDGTTEQFTSTGPGDFRGFTTALPITSITIDAPDVPVTAWATMDNLIVGAAN